MIDLNNILDNSIIICPNAKKDQILKVKDKVAPFKNIKLMDKSELIKGIYFTYDLDALVHLNKEYNYSYFIAHEILNNLINVLPLNDKLNNLYHIYQDLKDKKLLKENIYFKHLFNNMNIYIYGYSKLDQELISCLNNLNLKYQYIEEDIYNYKHTCYTFKSIDEEVLYVLEVICKLIISGKSLNNIYIYKLPSEYRLLLKKYFYYHNIPFESMENTFLYDSPLYKEYISYLDNHSFTDAYEILKEKTLYDPFDILSTLADVLLKVINLKLEKSELINLLNYLAKNKAIKKLKYTQSIKEIDEESVLTDDDYLFMLGFSLGNYPVIKKDIDFYSDLEKELLNKNTSSIINQITNNQLSNFILNTKNLTISFKEKLNNIVYYPSLLIEELYIETKAGVISNHRYSKELTEFEVAKYYDLNKLYGINHKNICTYTKEELGYNSFDHSFKPLDNYYNDDFLTLSYTQISEYNHCPFKYFIKRILKADIFEETFNIKLGILFHKILEDSANKEIDLDDYHEYINEHFETHKEKFFVRLLLPQVLDVINKNTEFKKNSMFEDTISEDEIIYKVDEKTNLIGLVDLTYFDKSDKNLIIVDYKTGNFKFNQDKINYGIDLQLPIYALLLQSKYHDFKISGMYIQNICLNKKALNEKNPYSLVGLTINDIDKAKRLDPLMGNITDEEGKKINSSTFIKGVAIKSDGTLSNRGSNLVDEDTFNNFAEVAKEQITLTVNNIRCGNFNISPIKFSVDPSSACEQCQYKDLCFREFSDIRHINISKNSDERKD